MSSTVDDGKPRPRRERDCRPLRILLSWIGLGRTGARRGSDARSQAGADLMDQAEAFQSLRVADVMTPRADITAVELSSSFETVVAAFADSEHSRLPVYRETLDDPVGVAHLKDVFKLLAGPSRRGTAEGVVLPRLKRETLYVPASMRAADLMVRMQ
ncbi:MAG: CBS domain-containing protein, partial [Caulobacteraceae bacterium]